MMIALIILASVSALANIAGAGVLVLLYLRLKDVDLFRMALEMRSLWLRRQQRQKTFLGV